MRLDRKIAIGCLNDISFPYIPDLYCHLALLIEIAYVFDHGVRKHNFKSRFQSGRTSLLRLVILVILLVTIPLTVIVSRDVTNLLQHAAGTPCHPRGVTHNPDSSYHFSWLHVAGGKIVDEQNCSVTVLGFNTVGTEFADAMGGGLSQSFFTKFGKAYRMNIWRLTFNVSWWNTNAYVPLAKMQYQDWMKQIIGWMKQNGDYVEIDPVTYVTIPPSADNVQYCANEGKNPAPDPNCITSQDTLNNPSWTEQQLVAATAQFWQSMVPLYKNDPAILYDALNEPYPSNNPAIPFFNNYREDLYQITTLIQQLNPKALVFVFGEGTDQIMKGTLPDYPQHNLVITYHIYDDPAWPWQSKIQAFQPLITWEQHHNHAVSIEEWGDNDLVHKKAFADAIMDLAKTQSVGSLYYAATPGGFLSSYSSTLTPPAQLLQQEYASVFPDSAASVVIPRECYTRVQYATL